MEPEPEAEIWSVEEWLEKIGMSEYAEGFVDNGYETVELITQMKAEDMDAVGVTDKQHRGILFTQARLLLEEATGTRPPPLSSASTGKHAVITLSISAGSASPTTPVSTSDYTEPWDNTASPVQSPLIAETSGYSEPWNSAAPKANGFSKAPVESTDGSKNPPPLPPPNKAPKVKSMKPPPSPGVNLPEYNGGKGLTKLQLKLKIRDELQKDAITLAEPPYCNEDGSQNDEKLVDLASEYADRFGVESLGVYDALMDVWRHTNNLSEFATPSPAPKVLHGGPMDNYEEPFDTQTVPIPTGKKVSGGSTPPKGKDFRKKSQTLPPSNQPTYEEPFDAVNSPDSSPEKVRAVKNEQSKTLPSPKIQKKEPETPAPEVTTEQEPTQPPISSHSSSRLSRFFKRDKKSRSIKLDDEAGKKGKKVQAQFSFPGSKNTKQQNKKRIHSVDNLLEEGEKSPPTGGSGAGQSVRASVVGYPSQNGLPHEPVKRRNSLGSSPSESEESPQQRKKHQGKLFQKFITPPTLKRNQSPEYPVSSGSDEDRSPSALRRIKQLGNRGGSDQKLNTRPDDEDNKAWLVTSRSYDDLTNTKQITKPDKKKGFFKRLLARHKVVTMPGNNHKKSKDVTISNTRAVSLETRESSLTSSVSMPDIASLKVLGIPSPNSEDSNLKPSTLLRALKHPPAGTRDPRDSNDSPSPVHPLDRPQVVISSAPPEISFLSSDPASKRDSLSNPVPMVRTESASSAKSVESTTSLTKPPPPPKPSTLTRKTTPGKRSSLEGNVTASKKTSRPNSEDRSVKPAPPPKPVIAKNKPVQSSTPAKPVQRSVKHGGGVTEQQKQEVKDSDLSPSNSQQLGSKESVGQRSSPDHVKRASRVSQGSSKSDSPTHGSPDHPQTPPPKPSRNYKSVKILSPPPPPAPTVTQTSSSESVKPSELFKRSGSPMAESPSHTPSLSQGSECSQEEQPIPKPQTSVDSNDEKPHPPSKPPRKSIKLKGTN